MRGTARLALAGLLRTPGRTLLRVAVLAVATALLGAMLLFIGNSLRTMTGSAVRSVPLDWQGPVASEGQATGLASLVSRQPGVRQASPVATAPFVAAGHVSAAGAIRTGAGSVLAVPPGYLDNLKTFRLLHGTMRPGQVVLDQQLAATLQAQIGDTVRLTPAARAAPRAYRVSGVALVTAPDVLFQPLDPWLGPAPAQPPAQIAILPFGTFAHTYATALRNLTPASIGTSSVPARRTGCSGRCRRRSIPPGSAPRPARRSRARARSATGWSGR